MSQPLYIPDTHTIDPRISFLGQKTYDVRESAQDVLQQDIQSNSCSNNQIIWNLTLNNVDTVVPRDIKMNVPIFVSITASNTGGTGTTPLSKVFEDGYIALRQFPLNSCISNATLNINNTTINGKPNQYVHQLTRYNFGQEDAQEMSETPCLPDLSQDYNDLQGSTMNPLGSYADSQYYALGRGAWTSDFVFLTDTATGCSFTANLVEPLFLDPLLYSSGKKYQEDGFIGLTQLQITLNFISNLSRIFSVNRAGLAAAQVSITNIAVTLGGQASPASALLLTKQITMSPMLAAKVPKQIPYGFTTFLTNEQSCQSIAPNATASVNFNSITTNQIPKYMLIFVKNSLNDEDSPTGYGLTDSCLPITAINITYGTRTLLSSMSQVDLYHLCVKNGYNQNLKQFQKFTGSVLKITPDDLGAQNPTQVAGRVGDQILIQMTITYKNTTTRTFAPTAFVVLALDSLLVIERGGNATQQLGVLTDAEILASQQLPLTPDSHLDDTIYGGSKVGKQIFSLLKKGVKALRDSKAISKTLSQFPQTQGIAQAASSLGFGTIGGAVMTPKMIKNRQPKYSYKNN